MNKINQLVKNLQMKGERITDVRREIISILSLSTIPLSPLQLQKNLLKKGLIVNKTTVYRQLAQLTEHGAVHQVRLQGRAMFYELTEDNHHHHLVCVRCKKILDINFKEDLDRQEKIIAQKKQFRVIYHSLEFFGLCKNCQRLKKV